MPITESKPYPVDSRTWPQPGRLDALWMADNFNKEIAANVEQSIAEGRGRPKLLGLLANGDPAGEMYAKMTQRACTKIGIEYELRRPERLDLEAAVIEANSDPTVHGLLVYYPVFGGEKDAYLRDVVSVEKDVEGLNHRYRYSLYHNIRTLDGERKCVLPCTPLACVKVLEALGAYDGTMPVGKQLANRTAVVFNRSEVVGRPLAAMLANDGVLVYSIDEFGMLLYSAGSVPGTIKVEETTMTKEEVLRRAEIVVSGVPSKAFIIDADSLRAGAICVNVSQHMNFGPGTDERCALVPAMGRVTIAMLSRNLLRLHANFTPTPTESAKDARATAPHVNPGMVVAGVIACAAALVASWRRGS